MGSLTERQHVLYKFIVAYWAVHGWPPSYREMAEHMGVSGPNGVMSHLIALEKKGYLVQRVRGEHRTVRIAGIEARCRKIADELMDAARKAVRGE